MLIRPLLLLSVTAIFALGLLMIFSTTSAEILDLDLDRDTHQAFFRQILYLFAGLMMAFGMWKLGYRRLLSLSPMLLFFFSFLLILTFIPGIGKEVNGSHRWLRLGGFSLQPSEFVKYLIPAFFIYRWMNLQEVTFRIFLRQIGVICIPLFLILIEPNNGTAGVIAMTLVALFFLMRIPFKYWAIPLLVFVSMGSAFALQLPYVSARLKVYLHPESDLKGKGHQPYQAKIAAGSGQFLGRGPGNSLQKLSYLPEAQNDFIAAIFAEEFGFLGMIIVISLYMLIAVLGFQIAGQSESLSSLYYGGAITFLICFQAFLNLGVVSGLLPSTGLNLPWFSQGGSSLMANLMGIGILLNIHASAWIKRRGAEAQR